MIDNGILTLSYKCSDINFATYTYSPKIDAFDMYLYAHTDTPLSISNYICYVID